MSELAKRVLTAVPLLTGLLLVLFAAPLWVGVAATTVIMLLAAWEWSAFLAPASRVARYAYVGLVAGAIALAGWLVPDRVGLPVLLWAAVAWWAAALVWILLLPTRVSAAGAGGAGVLVLVPAWLAIVAVLCVPAQGPELLLLGLAVIFAADVGAYFAGHRFGRVKLAPRVSPGKTWEGLIGGVLLAALVAAGGGALVGLPAGPMLSIGLGVAALSVVGDLTESMFKRHVGLKDSSHLIPGHGGVLDRLDSITAGMPLFALALTWLGRA